MALSETATPFLYLLHVVRHKSDISSKTTTVGNAIYKK